MIRLAVRPGSASISRIDACSSASTFRFEFRLRAPSATVHRSKSSLSKARSRRLHLRVSPSMAIRVLPHSSASSVSGFLQSSAAKRYRGPHRAQACNANTGSFSSAARSSSAVAQCRHLRAAFASTSSSSSAGEVVSLACTPSQVRMPIVAFSLPMQTVDIHVKRCAACRFGHDRSVSTSRSAASGFGSSDGAASTSSSH